MSNQENKIIANLVSSLIGLGVYGYAAIQKYQSGSFDSPGISSDWGRLILVAIGAVVIATIVMNILLNILHAIATRDENATFPDPDERDQIIELKANKVSYSVFGVGFMMAMITLTAGFTELVMFNLLVVSLFVAAIVGSIVQLVFYRRGF